MPYQDLRDFISAVDGLGALRRMNGADPHHEIGGITEVAADRADCPALLFDNIKGFAPGFRIFTNAVTNPARAALALGIDPSLRPLEALRAWMAKRTALEPKKPVEVGNPSWLQNSLRGDKVDLSQVSGAGLAPRGWRPLYRDRQPRRHA